MDSRHHHYHISDFKTDNSHWGESRCCMQGGLGVKVSSHEQPAG